MRGAAAAARLDARTFLLYADGFSKEMDINSASPDAVGPLPFHGMTALPVRPRERRIRDTGRAPSRVSRSATTPASVRGAVPGSDAALVAS